MPAEPTIRLAESAEDYAAFGAICRDYVDWCRGRYREIPWLVEEVFGYQSLDAELLMLAEKYGPPKGRTMIVERDGEVLAGGAYRRFSDTDCELKRLYVSDRAQGLGLGRKLTEALMASARADGFAVMKLDTGKLMNEAIALYGAMGFVEVEPYQQYPDKLTPYLMFMERRL